MARLVVADTGPLLAAADRSDRAHALAIGLLRAAFPNIVAPDAVIAEAHQMIAGRVSREGGSAFLHSVTRGAIRRMCLDVAAFERSVEYDARFRELALDHADCAVMALAERERARILTFDFRDFRATRPLNGGSWKLAIEEDQYRRLTSR